MQFSPADRVRVKNWINEWAAVAAQAKLQRVYKQQGGLLIAFASIAVLGWVVMLPYSMLAQWGWWQLWIIIGGIGAVAFIWQRSHAIEYVEGSGLNYQQKVACQALATLPELDIDSQRALLVLVLHDNWGDTPTSTWSELEKYPNLRAWPFFKVVEEAQGVAIALFNKKAR